jgi:hypothetical protein
MPVSCSIRQEVARRLFAVRLLKPPVRGTLIVVRKNRTVKSRCATKPLNDLRQKLQGMVT